MSASKLTEAFKELCAVCRVRADIAQGGIADAARRLWKVLGEYPEAVALKALDQWPRNSEWFPTEKELRALCEELAANEALAAASQNYVGSGRYNQPDGLVFQFVERVRGMRGDGYVKSWLGGGVTCHFAHNRIYTTGIGADRLQSEYGELARELGVAIIFDQDCSDMLKRHCDVNGLAFDPKGRRR